MQTTICGGLGEKTRLDRIEASMLRDSGGYLLGAREVSGLLDAGWRLRVGHMEFSGSETSLTPSRSGAAHTSPEQTEKYQYRGWPCWRGGRHATHAVTGVDKLGGAGVLEWCYGPADAESRLAIMEQYPRFERLHIDEWSLEF